MNFIWDKITEWLKGLLVSGIISNLSGLFDAINTRVGEAAAVVGTTPQAWHGGIFQMIRSLSENVVVPIAGIILTFIMCLELIQMLIDRNSLHDFDTFLFFKWIFKTFAAVLIVTNTWNIVMAVFDVAQNVVSQASGIIIGDTALDAAALLGDMEQALMAMEIGPLFGLWFQSSLMGILAWVLSICIFIVIYGRMIEIYMVTSIAPIPMATMVMGADGQQLSAVALCAGFSGIPHHGLRRDLCGTRAGHQRRRRHRHRLVDVHRLHGAAVLHALQNQQRREVRVQCPLTAHPKTVAEVSGNSLSTWHPQAIHKKSTDTAKTVENSGAESKTYAPQEGTIGNGICLDS